MSELRTIESWSGTVQEFWNLIEPRLSKDVDGKIVYSNDIRPRQTTIPITMENIHSWPRTEEGRMTTEISHAAIYGRYHCGEYDSVECACGEKNFRNEYALAEHLHKNDIHDECYLLDDDGMDQSTDCRISLNHDYRWKENE